MLQASVFSALVIVVVVVVVVTIYSACVERVCICIGL